MAEDHDTTRGERREDGRVAKMALRPQAVRQADGGTGAERLTQADMGEVVGRLSQGSRAPHRDVLALIHA